MQTRTRTRTRPLTLGLATGLLAAVLLPIAPIAPAHAAGLKELARHAPASGDLIVAAQIKSQFFTWLLAAGSLAPRATEKVLGEHLKAFATATGIDLQAPVTLVACVNKAVPDDTLVLGTATVDIALLAKAVRASPDLGSVELKEGQGRLVLSSGKWALVVRDDGTFVAGSRTAVKAALGRGGEPALATPARVAPPGAGLIEELESRTTGSFGMALLVRLPEGIPGPPPEGLPVENLAGLLPRIRSFFTGLMDKQVALALTFDAAEAASAAEPVVNGLMKQLDGHLGRETSAKAEAAKSHGPLAALDPHWVAAHVAQESVRELLGQVSVKADGPTVTLAVSREAFDLTPGPLVLTAAAGVLAAVAVPNFKHARDRANFRACYANQKTILGATEMYNLDKNTKQKELTPQFFQALKKDGYLQSIPSDPGQGPDSSASYYFTPRGEGGGIACKVHGSVDGAIPGSLASPKPGSPPGSPPGAPGGNPFAQLVGRIMAPRPDEWRSCMANQKTLAGAIEMYTLDKNTKVTEVTPALLSELKRDGYLRAIPADPGSGPGSESNYYRTPGGIGIACRVHGNVTGDIRGSKPRPPGR
jgi:competence protein ComGC